MPTIDNSLDAVLVQAKARTSGFITGTNQFFGGAGIYSRGPMGKTAVLHLVSKVALLDCATAKPVVIRYLASKQDGLPGEILRSSPLLPVTFEESRTPDTSVVARANTTHSVGASSVSASSNGRDAKMHVSHEIDQPGIEMSGGTGIWMAAFGII